MLPDFAVRLINSLIGAYDAMGGVRWHEPLPPSRGFNPLGMMIKAGDPLVTFLRRLGTKAAEFGMSHGRDAQDAQRITYILVDRGLERVLVPLEALCQATHGNKREVTRPVALAAIWALIAKLRQDGGLTEKEAGGLRAYLGDRIGGLFKSASPSERVPVAKMIEVVRETADRITACRDTLYEHAEGLVETLAEQHAPVAYERPRMRA